MPGALLQLVAYGAQDVYLTGNPQITFWKSTYMRPNNFALESIEQTFNGQADFGRRVTCTISRNGDLAFMTYLQVTLPEINQSMKNPNTNGVYARWLDWIGVQLISQVEIEIGGQRIDRQYGEWIFLWSQLTLPQEKGKVALTMIGNTPDLTFMIDPSFADIDGPCNSNAPQQICVPRNALPEKTLYVPLQFWFCTNPGLALPLIALQYHEVKINLDFRPIDECLWAVSSLNCDEANKNLKVYQAYNQSLVAASLYVDYVFLDTDERRRMAQNPHEYLIEQIQFTGDESVGSSSNKISLNFNHPCKELIWVVQPDENVDYCSSLTCNSLLFRTLGAQPFNFTDAVDALPNAGAAFSSPGQLNGQSNAGSVDFVTVNAWNENSDSGYYNQPNLGNPDIINSGISDSGSFVLTSLSLDMHCWGENPVVTAKLQLNGQDRFSEREGSYFDNVQPYQHHTRNPDTGINLYSFSLKPEEHQPSGTCNFSRIDNATLQLVLSNATVEGTKTAKVRVYAKNYNVLRVMSGMAGLAYSN